MTPLLNHENIGAVQKIAYLTATITSVDSANDTACFEGVGTCPSGTDVIIFYHCEADSVLRDNGALEGAAGAFSVDDEVIVQCEIIGANRYVPLRVMGFTDKPKKCGFGFKLTRGDETLITEDSELLTYIRLYNSDNISLSITELVYTPVPETGEDVDGYWSFNLTDSADADENGYWVDYSCEDGIATQYPYRYKAADKDQTEDLIPIGAAYEDIIPYWIIAYESNRPDYENYPTFPGLSCSDGISGMPDHFYTDGWSHFVQPSFFCQAPYYYTTQTSFYKKVIVKSSVPYKITEQLWYNISNYQHVASFGYDPAGVIGSLYGNKPCPEEDVLCLNYFASIRFHGEELDATKNTTDTWSNTSGQFIAPASVAEQSFSLFADIATLPEGNSVYSFCWLDEVKYEKYSAVSWYRFMSSKKEISTLFSIFASYDY